MASVIKRLESRGHCPAFHQGFFRKPALVLDAKFVEVVLDAVENVVHGLVVAHVLTFGVGHLHKGGVGIKHFAGDVDDVVALIVIFGPGNGHTGQFLGAQPYRKAQQAHLATGIVDVVFGVYVVASHAQQTGKAVAHSSAAPVAHVQGASGVGRNIFHQHLFASAARALAVAGGGRFNVQHSVAPKILREGHVAKTGASGLGMGHIGATLNQLLGKLLRQFAGVGLGLLGKQHGRVHRKIAVLGVAGRLNDGFDGPGKAFFFNNALEGRAQGINGAHSAGVLLCNGCGKLPVVAGARPPETPFRVHAPPACGQCRPERMKKNVVRKMREKAATSSGPSPKIILP